jgi:hypothetical protein
MSTQPSQSAKLTGDLSGSRSITRCLSRSTRIVPYLRLLLHAQSSTPNTITGKSCGSGVLRMYRSRVSGLMGNPNCVASLDPASPPGEKAMFSRDRLCRLVLRPYSLATPYSRSANTLRGHSRLTQLNRRTRTRKQTGSPVQGKSARLRMYLL